MARPLIAATCRIEETDVEVGPEFRLPRTYVDCVSEAGAATIVVPESKEAEAAQTAADITSMASGILLTGTGDIDPAFYGEEDKYQNLKPDRSRDALEIELVKHAMEKRLPVLGICRGIQAVNVALGGTLYQDLGRELPGAMEHMGLFTKESTFHEIEIAEDTRLHRILGTTRLAINTTHHQAVKDIAPSLFVNAVSSKDGVIEGIEAEGEWFLIGVQWHPERMRDEACKKLFAAFVEAAGELSR